MNEEKDKTIQVEATPVLDETIHAIIVSENGKCDKLTVQQKETYASWLCKIMAVDPSMRPIDFIPTRDGIKPYLNKGAAELIRDARGIAITNLEIKEAGNMYVVTCSMSDRQGRTDTDLGAWPKGAEPHNALMKAVTKAKRRTTLSLCRLGGLVEEAAPGEYANGSANQQQPKSSVLLQDSATLPLQTAPVNPLPSALFSDSISTDLRASFRYCVEKELATVGVAVANEERIEQAVKRAAKLGGIALPMASPDDCDKLIVIMSELREQAKQNVPA